MNIYSILTEKENKSANLLVESTVADMLPEQQKVVENIVRELDPLIKASITVDQINMLFNGVLVEQGSTRSKLGKGIDVVKKANEIVNKTGRWLQDTQPVQNFDAKFDHLRGKITEKFPKLAKNISVLGKWAKNNPKKTAAVVGVLTAIASLATGPIGGAIAGQILRGTSELLKGEKLSTALGKGVKTAALGFIAGEAIDELGDYLSKIRANIVIKDTFAEVSWDASKTIKAPGYEWINDIRGINIKVHPEDARAIKFLTDQIEKGSIKAFDELAFIAKEVSSTRYINELLQRGVDAANNDELFKWIQSAKDGLRSITQGAIAASSNKSVNPELDKIKQMINLMSLKEKQQLVNYLKNSKK